MSLRARLSESRILLAPGVYDALSALIATQASAETLYLSGASVAYARFGRPDIGLVDRGEVAETLSAIRERIETPIIVDADTGFGNALNVRRTVATFERAGASAIQLEDQTLPKRCGHLDGKSLISKGEMAGKIKAALDARSSDETLIVARTDAIAVEGLDAALERAAAYAEAGADVLFVEAPRDLDEMRRVTRTLGPLAPLLANMVEGGKTPLLPLSDLEAIGYRVAIFPGGAARAAGRAFQDYFKSLLETGSTQAFRARMLDLKGLNAIVGADDMLALGRTYDHD